MNALSALLDLDAWDGGWGGHDEPRGAPGKRTLTQHLPPHGQRAIGTPAASPQRAAGGPAAIDGAAMRAALAASLPGVDVAVQRRPRIEGATAVLGAAEAAEIATAGVAGGGSALPFAAELGAAFAGQDLSGVRAHGGAAARDAATTLDARAYAIGEAVAFGEAPDLFTAAHEVAHVIQQRQGRAAGGVDGDPALEHEADAVAARVVAGEPIGETLGAAHHGPATRVMQPVRLHQGGGHVTVDHYVIDEARVRTLVAREASLAPYLAHLPRLDRAAHPAPFTPPGLAAGNAIDLEYTVASNLTGASAAGLQVLTPRTAGAVTQARYRIEIGTSPDLARLFGSPADPARIATLARDHALLQERCDENVAEHVQHELIHLVLVVERAPSFTGAHGAVTIDFDAVLALASTGAPAAAWTLVDNAIGNYVRAAASGLRLPAGAPVTVPPAAIATTIAARTGASVREHLVNEWFANDRAGTPLGVAPSDDVLARRYGSGHLRAVLSDLRAATGRAAAHLDRSSGSAVSLIETVVIQQLTRFFAALRTARTNAAASAPPPRGANTPAANTPANTPAVPPSTPATP